ncbi:RNA-binding domain-containing protein [Streptomyces canus]|uniref:RNA-binding domain-containing protein n=1 Tax=Streptomyces TaxID=1883 RepID=UPI00159F1D71|nr:RNA-binding domain-containing protein [Streptomyces sp. LUP47B]
MDLKGELYGGNDRAKRDLAGDAAALANTAGGVLLLGVAEDDRQLRYPASR